MKKYETWEVIKMLRENPKLRFRYETCAENGIVGINNMDICVLECDGKEKEKPTSMPLHNGFLILKWTLIQQPIPFLEAVKAYAEGKTIRCEIEGDEIVYKPVIADYWKEIKEGCGQTLCAAEILNGTWYVEEQQ